MHWILGAALVGCAPSTPPVHNDTPGQTGPPPAGTVVEPTEPTVSLTVPLYGGTLATSGDRVVVADPLRDVVGVEDGGPMRTVFLATGSQPFRVALSEVRAFVTLRGTGEVLALDRAGNEQGRAAVCDHPRGVAVDADVVYVACAGGEVVSVDADTLQEIGRRWIGPDLRDVVVLPSHLFVSRFRSAEVVRLDRTTLEVVEELRPALETTSRAHTSPRVAWRMVAHPEGGALLLHQGHSDRPVVLEERDNEPRRTAYGGELCRPSHDHDPTTDPEDDSGPLVSHHLTHIRPDGSVLTGGPLLDVVLPIDVAVAEDGQSYRLATRMSDRPEFAASVRVEREDAELPQCVPVLVDLRVDQATSVGMSPDGRTIVYDRLRGRVWWGDNHGERYSDVADPDDLWTREREERLFHDDPGAGLACASCHPEGQDDGHVWDFEGLGLRRTQNLAGGVTSRGTFHWDAEFSSLDDLMQDVFAVRMAGGEVPPIEVEMLGEWLDGLEAIAASTVEPVGVLARGRALFDSTEVGCTACHSGPQLSDHRLHTVATDRPPTKTPSLLGVGTRAPFMSDGCAASILQRIEDPACGGDQHGMVEHLSSDDRHALATYVSTL